MILGLDSAAAGMKARLEQQDAIASNLANVNTAGYRRKAVGFSVFQQALQNSTLPSNNTQVAELPKTTSTEDTRPGAIVQTGVSSDLALEGPGFFVVQDGTGEKLTRGGTFHTGSDGTLMDSSGSPVLGERGPIKVTSGDWSVDADGSVRSGGTVMDKLQIRPDPSSTDKSLPAVVSGCLESSNVNTVQEMISMISAMRAYESCQKSIQNIDGTLDKVINQMQK